MKDIVKTKVTCYCGKPEGKNEKMMCCVKCKRWLHAECIKCLDREMLYGDSFYIIVCSICNSGCEFLARLELSWTELVHLVLYHLTMSQKLKYFDLDESIMPFIFDHWDKLHLFGPILSSKKENRRNKVIETLQNNSRFKSGKEIKKSKNIWALRVKEPPESPHVQPSSAKLQNDTVVWEFQVKDRHYHILNQKKSKNSKDGFKNGKSRMKNSSLAPTRSKQGEVSKCRGGLPYNENGVHKAKHKLKRSTVITFDAESARIGLLESLIPYPPDFQHSNNPFRKTSKINSHKKTTSQSQHKSTNKRRWKLEITYQETTQRKIEPLNDAEVPSCSHTSNESSVINAKDSFSHNSENTVKSDFSIIGRRITSSGMTQYLFQR